MRVALCAAILSIAAGSVFAQPLQLTPAKPQPKGLKQGLAVKYAPARVRTLRDAEKFARKAKPGKPLAGLDYRDTATGQNALTSGRAQRFVAEIEGYVRFDAPGIYKVDFLSNDGLRMSIGGQEVVFFDGIHGCEPSDLVEVNVPSAGWYELEGLYFQKEGTACLHMRAGKDAPDWMPNSAFGYK